MSTLGSWTSVTDIVAEVPLANKVFNLVFEVMALLGVMFVLPMEATISSPVSPFEADQIRRPKDPLLSDLEENLYPGTPRIFATKRATNWAKGSSFPWLSPRREVAVGLGRALARKFSLNSFASWLNEEIKDGFRHLFHIRADPLSVVGKHRHVSVSEVS
ncbi:hypothetical protein BHE74_00021434 [Ensete ventricosum]|nr:hypothetical protein BHE74_00021434 [Ensete ventricosum]